MKVEEIQGRAERMNEKQTCRVAVTLYLGRDLQFEEWCLIEIQDRISGEFLKEAYNNKSYLMSLIKSFVGFWINPVRVTE